jgi:hypothetical protein
MPRLTSQAFAGHEVKYPMIMPTCMRSQHAAELGIRWCGAGKSRNAPRVRTTAAELRYEFRSCYLGCWRSLTMIRHGSSGHSS